MVEVEEETEPSCGSSASEPVPTAEPAAESPSATHAASLLPSGSGVDARSMGMARCRSPGAESAAPPQPSPPLPMLSPSMLPPPPLDAPPE